MSSNILAIYLDQNKWIELARLCHYSTDPATITALTEFRQRVTEHKCFSPISHIHVMETQRCGDIDRRARLAKIMATFSRGWTLAPHTVVVPIEIERALCRIFQKPVPEPPSVLGRGIPHAFGEVENMHQHLDTTEEHARKLMQLIDNPKHFSELIIGDKTDTSAATTRSLRSMAADQASRVERARAKLQQHDLATRKKCYAAELTYDLQDTIKCILQKLGLSMDSFLGLGPEGLMKFWEDVPTIQVELELAVSRDSHWDRGVDPNDTYDLGFLCVAIPYCDVVITENFWVHLAQRHGLHTKYNTAISSQLTDVVFKKGVNQTMEPAVATRQVERQGQG